MAQPSIIFNGTPYEFYGFVMGLIAEVYLGLGQEQLIVECYTLAAKDFEEEIPQSRFPTLGYPYNPLQRQEQPIQPRKRTVSKQTHVVPEANSSVVFVNFRSSSATILDVRGWITAQKLPNQKSKLILNFDYSNRLYMNFWQIAHLKMQTEGWIANQPAPPQNEPTSSDLDEWFEYKQKSGLRISLGYIAKKTRYSYGYVRQKHSEYIAEHGE